jgi:hypothetical protein
MGGGVSGSGHPVIGKAKPYHRITDDTERKAVDRNTGAFPAVA